MQLNIKSLLIAFLFTLLSINFVNAQASDIIIDQDKEFNYSEFSSFTFMDEDFTAETDPKVLALYSMVKNALLYEMDIRDIVLNDSNPAFYINYLIFEENNGDSEADVDDQSLFRFHKEGGAVNKADLSEGTLIISIIDNASGEPVWEGYAPGLVDKAEENLRKSQVRIRKAVHQMVKELEKAPK